MTVHRHAAVWLDHDEARIFHVDLESFDESKVHSPHHHFHRHPKGPHEPREHPDDQAHYFQQIAGALADAEEVLVMGPSTAKLHFLRYAREHAPALEPRIVGLETVDHPSDAQLVAYVKRYFAVSDLRVTLK
jgi:stalled ribosome rescue protein Dom34